MLLLVELKGKAELPVCVGKENEEVVDGKMEAPGGNCAKAVAAKRGRSQSVNAILMSSVLPLL